jgi:RimJ/RimL family protein N-acetyltransferase
MDEFPGRLRLPNLKCDRLDDAQKLGLRILEDNPGYGSLIPVGPWVLEEDDLLAKMALWRESAMDMFFARFQASVSSTRDYLSTHSIALPNRILFIIEANGRYVGHLGLSNVGRENAEIDNVIRGELGEPRKLMTHALERLLVWAEHSLRIKSVQLRVISTNSRAIRLYSSLGFQFVSSDFLREWSDMRGATHLIPCSIDTATVREKSHLMEMHFASARQGR